MRRWLLILTVAGCSPDFHAPAPGLQIRCTEAGDCPRGLVCRRSVQLCVSATQAPDDQLPRIVGDVARSPAVGGRRTLFVVQFRVNEPLAELPRVEAEVGGKRLAFSPSNLPSTDPYEFIYLVRGDEPEGTATLLVSLVDLEGNRADELPAGSLELDLTPPGSFDRAKLTHHRSPTERRAWLFGDPGALGPMHRARVYEAASSPAPISEAQGAADGALPETLLPTDPVVVFVSQVDEAGNEGQRFEVKRHAWEATFALKVTGNAGNPHRAFHSDATTPAPLPTRRHELDTSEYAGLAPATGLSWTSEGARPLTWERLDASPSGRWGHVLSCDRLRGRLVLFGGADEVGAFDETWERSANGWVQRRPSRSPSARTGSALAYDALRARALLFGGSDGALRDDTWSWDGSDWSLAPGGGGAPPEARERHAMAYDPVRLRVVLFGGRSAAGPMADTWEWDGQQWLSRAPSAAPEAREGHAMAFDAVRSRVVLFGGRTPAGPMNDLWEWDGQTWAPVPASTPPPARSEHALDFDPATGRLVVFGGWGAGSVLGDTWEWDGQQWAPRAPTRPVEARRGQQGAHCPSAGAGLVMFGGRDDSGAMEDTWEWSGGDWARRSAEVSPPARDSTAMAYDAERGSTVMFGGALLSGSAVASDTWVWTGISWRKKRTTVKPSARELHALAYDAQRRRVVMFGGSACVSTGCSGETWEWDGVAWEQKARDAGPPGRRQHAMAYDSARGVVALYGGLGSASVALGDLWEWDGGSWSQVTAAAPSPRYSHAMAYDSARARLQVCGGTASGGLRRNELWEFDGQTWALAPGGCPVDPSPVMAYDAQNRRTFLTGATTFFSYEWDGGAWALAPAAPGVPAGQALAYDSARSRMVAFGAERGHRGTWEWSGATRTWSSRAAAIQPASVQGGMAHDPMRGKTWLFCCGLSGVMEREGLGWRALTPSGPALAGVEAPAWDEVHSQVVMYGFTLSTQYTFLFDGGATTRLSTSPRPTSIGQHALAFHGPTQRTVLFGGRPGFPANGVLDETWEWDGQAWTPRGAGPPPRADPAMAADRARGRVVLFGGFASLTGGLALTDTWEWDGQTWAQQAPRLAPPGGSSLMAYDGARRRVVYLAPRTGGTWEWDGQSWTPLVLEALPFATSNLTNAAMTAVGPNGPLLLFGGSSLQGTTETWTLGTPATRALVNELSLSAAGVAGPLSGESIVEVSVALRAGGTSVAGPGAVVEVWDRSAGLNAGDWRSLAATNAAAAAPEAVSGRLSVTAAGSLRGLVTGDKLYVRVRPLGDAQGAVNLAVRELRLRVVSERP